MTTTTAKVSIAIKNLIILTSTIITTQTHLRHRKDLIMFKDHLAINLQDTNWKEVAVKVKEKIVIPYMMAINKIAEEMEKISY